MIFKKEISNFSNRKNQSFILNFSESFVVKDIKHDLEISLNYILSICAYFNYQIIIKECIIVIFKRKIFYLEFD